MRSLKALLAVAIFGALVYVAYQVVPVYMSSYQFQDAVEEEARLDSYSQKTEQDNQAIPSSRKPKQLEFRSPRNRSRSRDCPMPCRSARPTRCISICRYIPSI